MGFNGQVSRMRPRDSANSYVLSAPFAFCKTHTGNLGLNPSYPSFEHSQMIHLSQLHAGSRVRRVPTTDPHANKRNSNSGGSNIFAMSSHPHSRGVAIRSKKYSK